MKRYAHLINGVWHEPAAGDWLGTVNPTTGQVWARIARGNQQDANAAVSAAHTAFTNSPWRRSTTEYRAQVLYSVADVLEKDWEQLVESEVRDNGKRITEVRGQFSGLHHWYRHFANEVLKLEPYTLDNDTPGVENTAHYEPYGVVAAITPWNSPLMIAAWKLAPALAAGNTVVIKPSEHASVSTLEFAELISSSELPNGVVNVVTGLGNEVGEALVSHAHVAKVSFTGSDYGGSKVAQCAAQGVKPVTLELGGKSPQLVFADADMQNAVNGVFSGIFLSNGQTCVAGSRVMVERSIHDEFVQRLCDKANALRMGDPMSSSTEVGPLANKPHLEKVLSTLATAKSEGANCLCGGNQAVPDDMPDGYFVEPTIFTGVESNMRLWREEVFGPVLAVTSFDNEAQAVSLANDTDYGLAAGIWTTNQERANRVAHQIEAGTVYINHYRSVSAGSPIGGYKRSGYGRELGPDAIKAYSQLKSIWNGTSPVADPFPPC